MADKLKWADVAHHYQFSGVEMERSGKRFTFSGVLVKSGKKFAMVNYPDGRTQSSVYHLEEYLPVLRAKEDITEPEAREMYTLKTKLPPKYLNRLIIRGRSTDVVSVEYLKKYPRAKVIFVDISNKATRLEGSYSAKELHWLLLRGFNVFDLEWESEAIRKEVQNG